MNPLDWPAIPFLVFYAVVTVPLLLGLQRWSVLLGPPVAQVDIAELGMMEIAYLAGGPQRVTDTALVGLFEAEAAVLDRHRNVALVDPAAPVPPELLPFRYAGASGISRQNFHAGFGQHISRMRDALLQRGLVPSDHAVGRFRTVAILVLCVPAALAIGKIAVGVSRDRPVGFLTVALIATFVWGALLVLQPPTRSRAGSQVLTLLRRTHARAARAPLPEELPLAFALTGITVLDGQPYQAFLRSPSSSDGGSGGEGGGGGDSGCGGCSA